jgi:hypothetical protein
LWYKTNPRQIVLKTLSQKKSSQKRADGMAQGLSPEFKLQYCKKQSNIIKQTNKTKKKKKKTDYLVNLAQ